MFVSSLLQESVTRWPRRVAVIDGERKITYAELGDRVHRLANALLALGLRAGDRLVDLQSNRHTYVETDLACAVAGIVRIPANPRLTLSNWEYIATDSGARAIVFSPDFAEPATQLLESVDSLELGIRTAGQGGGESLEQLIEDSSPQPTPRLESPDEVLALHYSSGTTGLPKGCIRTAANRLASAQDMLASVCEGDLGCEDVFVHAGPLTHASGLFLLPHLAVGATQVVMRHFDAEELVALIDRHGVTGTVLVPTMLERLLAALPEGRPPAEQIPSMKRIAYAGAPMAPARIARAVQKIGPRLVQFYGMVEAIPPLTVLSREDHLHAERLTAAGRPVLGAAVRIVDPEFRPVAAGEPGELLVGGSHVMAGYWENEDSTGKTLREGWLRTGDMARVDEQGLIHLGDRKADMIISGGYNVMPREVEDVISQDPDVLDVAVVGVPDVEWGEVVTAVIVTAKGAAVSAEDVSARCADELSGFKRPRAVHFTDSLPKGSTGKILRRQVRDDLERARDRA